MKKFSVKKVMSIAKPLNEAASKSRSEILSKKIQSTKTLKSNHVCSHCRRGPKVDHSSCRNGNAKCDTCEKSMFSNNGQCS
jgi:hypothetical protein